MSCINCMDYKPGDGSTTFKCPECSTLWILAGVSPGNYWEPLERDKDDVEKPDIIQID